MYDNFFGGDKGIRTPGLLNAIQTRYQLRHAPVVGFRSMFCFRQRNVPNNPEDEWINPLDCLNILHHF